MRNLFIITLLLGTLTACGFQLRGSQALPFSSIYLDIPVASEFSTNFRRVLNANATTVVSETRENAAAIFQPLSETREKDILAINSSGQVSEFRLRYQYAYRIIDPAGNELIPPTSINLQRDFTFSDSYVLAKEQEENLLWRDMQSDLIQQIMRRLSAAKPKAPAKPVSQGS